MIYGDDSIKTANNFNAKRTFQLQRAVTNMQGMLGNPGSHQDSPSPRRAPPSWEPPAPHRPSLSSAGETGGTALNLHKQPAFH